MITTKKSITAQFQTWINFLSSLDINMEYQKGELHSNADAMSRQQCSTCVQCQMIHPETKSGKLKTRILTLMTDDGGVECKTELKKYNKLKTELDLLEWVILN